MNRALVVDADGHVVEPPEMLNEYIEPKFRDRIPKYVKDEKGRVVAGIIPNSDMGDSWEYADSPTYPEKYSALAYRIGVDYVIYSMTH